MARFSSPFRGRMGGGGRLDFVKQFLRHDTRPVRTKLLKSGCTNRECTRIGRAEGDRTGNAAALS